LQLALERLDASRWQDFEELCAAFMASNYPNLITMGAVSGDRGRDGVLWQPEEDPSVVLQYSVTANWSGKINDTVARLKSEFPGVQVLIFCSSQIIGPDADAVVEKVRRESRIFVQVRDRSWFLDRVNSDAASTAAAERLVKLVVEPFLASEGIVDSNAQALTDHEAAAGVVYLALQLEDDTLEKGLTKTCFDGLVRAALRNTDPKHTITREEVRRRVAEMLPTAPYEDVVMYTNSSLQRMERRFVRLHKKPDHFCLSYDERSDIAQRLIVLENLNGELRAVIAAQLEHSASALEVELPDSLDRLTDRSRELIAKVLLERGEAFVRAVEKSDVAIYTVDELLERVVEDVAQSADACGLRGNLAPLLANTIHSVLGQPRPELLAYLQLLARSYTLFSLLKSTPNVQSALVKMFSGGEIWLDTTAALPLFAETLLDDDERFFTSLIGAAREAGVKFFVTPGVIEEIERHMNRSFAYTRVDDWHGSAPFLASAYALAGMGDLSQIGIWLEDFRGSARPEDDIADYLKDEFGIRVQSLAAELDRAPADLRAAVKEEWMEIQERRRVRSASQIDPITSMKLANHDAENYLGVIERRGAVAESTYGYRCWWLTLDRAAYRLHSRLKERLDDRPPAPPVLSPDFLSQYLSIGPIRQYLKKGTETRLPLMLEVGALDFVAPELLDAARTIRDDLDRLTPRVRRRRLRDFLDAERRRQGPMAKEGLGVIEDGLAG
jgi:hypothetical protein